MSLFEKRSAISRKELKKILGDTKKEKRLNQRQRQGLVHQAFTRKRRALIFKKDYEIAIRGLKHKRHQAKDYREKLGLNRKIKFLEELEKAD